MRIPSSSAKDSHILPTKNSIVFVIFKFEILTKHLLTTSLISNNRPLEKMRELLTVKT